MTRTPKTMEYRRAEWFKKSQPLETHLRNAWAKLPTTAKRVVEYGDGTCMGIASKDFGDDGFAIHCALFVDKQGVGTIPMEDKISVALGERKPGEDENFLITDIFAVVSGNDITSINASINAAKLRTFLYKLFEKAELGEDSTKFDILRRADINKLMLIEQRGVEEIDLRSTIAEATLDRIKELSNKPDWLSKAKANLLKAVRAIAEKDADSSNLLESKDGKIKLSIRVPDGDLQEAKSGLKALADEFVGDSDEDGFVIHLHGGEQIKSSEIAIRRKVRIEKHANTVHTESAWSHLKQYMIEQKMNNDS